MKKIIVVTVENFYDSYDTHRSYFTFNADGFNMAVNRLTAIASKNWGDDYSYCCWNDTPTFKTLKENKYLRFNDDNECWATISIQDLEGPNSNLLNIE